MQTACRGKYDVCGHCAGTGADPATGARSLQCAGVGEVLGESGNLHAGDELAGRPVLEVEDDPLPEDDVAPRALGGRLPVAGDWRR